MLVPGSQMRMVPSSPPVTTVPSAANSAFRTGPRARGAPAPARRSARHVLAVPSPLAVTARPWAERDVAHGIACGRRGWRSCGPSPVRQTRAVWSVLAVAIRRRRGRTRPRALVRCARAGAGGPPATCVVSQTRPARSRPLLATSRPPGENAASVTARRCLTRPSCSPVATRTLAPAACRRRRSPNRRPGGRAPSIVPGSEIGTGFPTVSPRRGLDPDERRAASHDTDRPPAANAAAATVHRMCPAHASPLSRSYIRATPSSPDDEGPRAGRTPRPSRRRDDPCR